jgi:hypothetical protein
MFPAEVAVTMDRERPAAYIRAVRGGDSGGDGDLARQHEAVADGARQRGWPPPTVYVEDDSDPGDGHAPALLRLEAAIEAGRHDALLITDPGAVTGTATHLTGLLSRCTRHGVVVGFLLPPALADTGVADPRLPTEDIAPFPVASEAWGVLARARIEALSGLFPAWRIWLDQAGWHARRRDTMYLQIRQEGAPAFSVHADSPTDLAAQLCWQQAADRHAPDGCSVESPRLSWP